MTYPQDPPPERPQQYPPAPPPGYPSGPQYGGYPQPTQQGNGLAIAGFVCGLVGLLILNIILGPLALIFGGIGLSRANKGAPHRGLAIGAFVLGAIDVILFFILLAILSNRGFVY